VIAHVSGVGVCTFISSIGYFLFIGSLFALQPPATGNDAPEKIIAPLCIDYFNLHASVLNTRYNGFIVLIYQDKAAN
jgi:hypothetical protein